MNKVKIKKYVGRIFLAIIITSWLFLIFYSSPEKLVDWIGVKNAYAMMFFLALLGGMSTFSGIPYHLVLVSLSLGGLNPFFLGLFTALGVMLGDATSYFIASKGEIILPENLKSRLHKIHGFSARHPKLLPLFFLFYGSFSPLSNDFIVISMGLARYPFWKVMLPLGAGNLIFNISLAFLAEYVYDLLPGLFS